MDISNRSTASKIGIGAAQGRFCLLLVADSVVAWRFAHDATKLFTKVALVGESELAGNDGDRFFRIDEGATAHAHTYMAYVLVRRAFVVGSKLALEGTDGEAASGR